MHRLIIIVEKRNFLSCFASYQLYACKLNNLEHLTPGVTTVNQKAVPHHNLARICVEFFKFLLVYITLFFDSLHTRLRVTTKHGVITKRRQRRKAWQRILTQFRKQRKSQHNIRRLFFIKDNFIHLCINTTRVIQMVQ